MLHEQYAEFCPKDVGNGSANNMKDMNRRNTKVNIYFIYIIFRNKHLPNISIPPVAGAYSPYLPSYKELILCHKLLNLPDVYLRAAYKIS